MAGSPEFLSNLSARFRDPVVQRITAGVAVVVVVGAVTAVKFMGHNDDNANAPAKPVAQAQAPIRHAAPRLATQANNAANNNNNNAANNVANNTKTIGPEAAVVNGKAAAQARAASTDGTGAPVVTAVTSNTPGATAAHLDDHLTYQYNALGRRDPFQSLVDGQFVGADVGGDAPPDPGGIKVVGIVWGTNDQFALVEDVRGNSYVLRKGDKVQNGYVENLKRDAVVVNITADGQSQSVVIPLVRKGDSNAR